jgi:hypothetical protein
MARYKDILNGVKNGIDQIKADYDYENKTYPENEYQEDRLSLISDNDSTMDKYRKDFYEMSVGSIKTIMSKAYNILKSLEDPAVKNNLTESWLQGKIAVTEDYMNTIHNFVMYGRSETDTEGRESRGADKPGLWENIRKKKEREGKKYRPAKPGDKDRPDSEQWKRLTKKNK